MTELAALTWSRPAGALALLLPVLLVLLVRSRSRPPLRATGTLRLWRDLASDAPPTASRARPRTPLAVWLAAAALVAGAMALAGPRLATSAAPRRWTVLLDPSPSMALVHEDGESRAQVAARAAVEWLNANAGARDRVTWTRAGREPLELDRAATPPASWFEADREFHDRPHFDFADRAGAIWLTDRAPDPLPRRAGCFASGGAAVPGPIAGLPGAHLVWDGAELAEAPLADAGEVLLRSTTEPPAPIRRVFNAWARAREFTPQRAEATSPDARLTVHLLSEAPRARLALGRDGWHSFGVVSPLLPPATAAPGTRWLSARAADGEEWPVVDFAPGLVRIGALELEEPGGDPAAFVVSWSELFDRALLPPAGVVPLGERVAAGPAVEVAPSAPAPWVDENAPEPESLPLATWLALVAALLAGMALLRRG